MAENGAQGQALPPEIQRLLGEQGAPQAMAMPPVKETVYPYVEFQLATAPDGRRILIFVTPFEKLMFPFDPDKAEQLGKALAAPSVVVP